MVTLRAPYTADQIEGYRCWQTSPGAYQAVQRLLRSGPRVSREQLIRLGPTVALIDSLMTAIDNGFTTQDLRVYRGVRTPEHLHELHSGAVRLSGLLATSLDPDVTHEFIPDGGGILAIDVPEGTSALDGTHLGHPSLAYQREILFSDQTRLAVTGYDIGRALSTDQRLADTVVVRARLIHD